MLRQRRRHRCGAHICALLAAVLLLLSVTLLYSRINFFQSHSTGPHQHSNSQYDGVSLTNNPLVDDSTDSLDQASNSDDLIDEHDDAILNAKYSNSNGDDFLLGGESEDDVEDEDDDVVSGQNAKSTSSSSSSLYYFDHQNGVVRRGFNKKSIEEWEDYVSFESKLGLELGFSNGGSKTAFGSDDIPVDEKTRKKLTEVNGIEDALLLKGSKLREGWGEWFDKKSDFLRRDRMFKSNLEGINPMNNPILQDPDMPGVTMLTRGDKLVQKGVLNEFKKVPFLVKKPLAVENSRSIQKDENVEVWKDEIKKIKMSKRKTLDNANSQSSHTRKNEITNNGSRNHGYIVKKADNRKDWNGNGGKREGKNVTNEFSGLVYADGRRWGYYPGLDSRLSFSNFMDAFFRKGKCNLRVFMVWNSPPWMFSVRYQRGLESVLYHHPDACVVVFSETLELNFFSSFVEDGFKVAVVMPNLDELLQDTPTHIFASVWYEWKKTKYYPVHYSELIRLAALYKYGGIYLDSDVIVLKKLLSLNCTVGLEDEQKENTFNGAVMAFRKHSPFIMECLTEFYASYDDTQLRWNGADLLTRVALNFSSNKNPFDKRMELRVLSSSVFFPISRSNISRYFSVSLLRCPHFQFPSLSPFSPHLQMDPPPLSAPPIAAVAPPAPPQTAAVASYADSVESSPRSRKTDSWDEPPYGPTTTASNNNATAAHPTTTATAASKLRLMCSYGGHIVPRPHDKSLCYVGGDTRIIVVDRQTTLSDLSLRLSKTLLSGKSFSLKYQLPNEDLDSLISVTTDEDLENMVEEYDRLNSSSNPASKASRLRLFIFPSDLDSETSSSIESLLENSSKSNEWFFNALNWNTTASCKVRGFSETSSVNCLLGLDDAAASVENHSAVNDVGDAQLDASLSVKSEGGRSGKGINNNNNNNLASNVTNTSNVGQDVHSVPDSPMLETSSSFGSTSSSPSMANLPPIRVHSEEGINQKGVMGLGVEEQFSQLNVGVGVNNVQKQEDAGFVVGVATMPPAMAAPGTAVSGFPVMVGGEYPNRVFSDDERSEQGVPVGLRKAPQVQQYQQQVPQSLPQPQTTQFQQNKAIGVVDLPSPDSVSSDGSVPNPLSWQKAMMQHEPIVQMQSGNGRNSSNQIDLKASDLNSRVPMPQHLQDSGYVLQSQFDQYQQLHQQQQFVPASNQYIHHHPPGAMPMYYPIYTPQQLGHAPGLEHQYPFYFMPARQPQAYNLPLQQPSYSEPTPTAPSSRPQTPPATMVPPTAFNPAPNATTAPKPEMTAGAYRTSASAAPHMGQVPSSQTPQYGGYSQIHHPSQSIAPSSAATGNYAYEFADPTHAQIYYTQPLAPQLASAQYQTMTSTAQVKLPEASAQLPTETIKQQVRATQQ